MSTQNDAELSTELPTDWRPLGNRGETVTQPRTTHELKTWTDYFQVIVDGRKNFEVRYNDRGFQAGDYVRLVETDSRYTGRRNGRIIDARIGYVLSQPIGRAGANFDGFVVFSLLDIREGRL
jgi:hypothetical protein